MWMYGYVPATSSNNNENGNPTISESQWLLESITGISGAAAANNSGCLALHVRRGDACINDDRRCNSYQEYWDAVSTLQTLYDITCIVVLTDADDFPWDHYTSHFDQVHSISTDRSQFNVNHLKGKDFEAYAPENRGLVNVTAPFFEDLALSSRCRFLVGGTTSAVSRILLSTMTAVHGSIPPYVLLQGCPHNTKEEAGIYGDDFCVDDDDSTDEHQTTICTKDPSHFVCSTHK